MVHRKPRQFLALMAVVSVTAVTTPICMVNCTKFLPIVGLLTSKFLEFESDFRISQCQTPM